jgi:DNA-binding transcriptional LysR family regulator
MRAFVSVAEEGQFAAASERLGLSRTMASKLVMDLESHLGARLLNRTTRKVSLTEQGAAYLERCREVLLAIEEAEREVSSQASEPIGRLRISAPVCLGASHIAPQVAAFAATHPQVSIDLVLNDRMVDLVEEGYDIAIRVGRLSESTLIARRIGEMRLICCTSPAYIKAHGRPASPNELSGHECILYSYASTRSTWLFSIDGSEIGVKVGGRISSNNGAAICEMAISGLGIILQPDFIVARHLRSGALEQLFPDQLPESVGIYAVYQSRRHVPARLRLLLDHLSLAFSQNIDRSWLIPLRPSNSQPPFR